MRRAVVLFSGGLDSILTVRILQTQGFEVEAIYVRTLFVCCGLEVAQAAAELGVRLTVVTVGDDYLEILRKPAHGYGKGANPCVDCRIAMARLARRLMEQLDAVLVASGEVLGQREMSQKRLDLGVIARESDLEGRLLRPLSAKLLPPTLAEQEGLVSREDLHAFSGRGRKGLIELARELNVRRIPAPSSGCALANRSFAPRVFDLLEHRPKAARWEFELLALGRHLRWDERTKIIVSRNAEENAQLRHIFREQSGEETIAHLEPATFAGPDVLVTGSAEEAAMCEAAALAIEYAHSEKPATVHLRLSPSGPSRELTLSELPTSHRAQRIG